MNGKRYLLDTNAVIQLLAGNPSHCGNRACQRLRGHYERRPFRPPKASPGKDIRIVNRGGVEKGLTLLSRWRLRWRGAPGPFRMRSAAFR